MLPVQFAQIDGRECRQVNGFSTNIPNVQYIMNIIISNLYPPFLFKIRLLTLVRLLCLKVY